MAVSTIATPITYDADGVVTDFVIPWAFEANDHVRCALIDPDGVVTEPEHGAGLTVVGDAEAGFYVRFAVAPADGSTVALYRAQAPLQTTPFNDQGRFPAARVEQMGDRLARAIQDVKVLAEGAFRFSPADFGKIAPLDPLDIDTRQILAIEPDPENPGRFKVGVFFAGNSLDQIADITQEISDVADIRTQVLMLAVPSVLEDIALLAVQDTVNAIAAVGAPGNIDAIAAIKADLDLGASSLILQAITAAQNAAVSAGTASTAASNAAASGLLAQKWAQNDPGDFPDNVNFPARESARTYAGQALLSDASAAAAAAIVNARFLGRHVDAATALAVHPTALVGAVYYNTTASDLHWITSLSPAASVSISSFVADLAALKGAPPASLDTLEKIAASIDDDPDIAGTLRGELVTGPASAVADQVMFFDGTTGKLAKGGGIARSALLVSIPAAGVGGTANAIALTLTGGPALTDALALAFRPAAANTGPVTINLNGEGAVALEIDGAALSAGELSPTAPVVILYDQAGGRFRLLSGGGGVGQPVETIADLTALPSASLRSGEARHVAGIRGGAFFWDDSDLSAEVAHETSGYEIEYYAPDDDPTGASGAWRRASVAAGGPITPQMAGVVGAGTDETAGIDAVLAYFDTDLGGRGGAIFFPATEASYAIADVIKAPSGCILYGAGEKSLIKNISTGTDATKNIFAFGQNHPSNYSSYTYYTLNAISAGAASVTASTAAEAGNFSAGQVVMIRSNEEDTITDGVNPFYVQLNRVVSANPGTGVITLKYPVDESVTNPRITAMTGHTFQGVASFILDRTTIRDMAFETERDWNVRGASFECAFENILIVRATNILSDNTKGYCVFRNIRGVYTNKAFELTAGSHHNIVSGITAGYYDDGNSPDAFTVAFGGHARNNILTDFVINAGSHVGDDPLRILGRKNKISNGIIAARGFTGHAVQIRGFAAAYADASLSSDNEIDNVTVEMSAAGYIDDVIVEVDVSVADSSPPKNNIVKNSKFYGGTRSGASTNSQYGTRNKCLYNYHDNGSAPAIAAESASPIIIEIDPVVGVSHWGENGFEFSLGRTSDPATHNRSVITRGAGENLTFQTRQGDGTFVSTDYDIELDSAGALRHTWKIGNTTRMSLEDNRMRLSGVVFGLGAAVAAPIVGGAISLVGSYMKVDTQDTAATDDLDTIGAGQEGDIICIEITNNARTVVVKDGVGNLRLAGEFTMDTTQDKLWLIYNSAGNWQEFSRSNNAS